MVMMSMFWVWFEKDFHYFHFNESLNLYPNIFHEDINLEANFISKMSKLLGEGRQKNICQNLFLSILGYQVGRVDPCWTYVEYFVVFVGDSLPSSYFFTCQSLSQSLSHVFSKLASSHNVSDILATTTTPSTTISPSIISVLSQYYFSTISAKSQHYLRTI